MAKKCSITGKGVQVGHNVSHAQNKTKKRFLPNLQMVTFLSGALGAIKLRVSTNGLRTVEKAGGIDAYLEQTSSSKLTEDTRILKRRLEKASGKKSGAAAAQKAA